MEDTFTPRIMRQELQGKLIRISPQHEALDREDECSECGKRLSTSRNVYFADTGRYCSHRCAESHGDYLADVMNRRRTEDK